jgi:hypothetical protein
VWKPDLERIKKVVVKNARGHAFFEIGEPIMHQPASIRIFALAHLAQEEREAFEDVGNAGLYPEVGSRMFTRVSTGQDLNEHGWVMVQEGAYRYSAVQIGLMTIKSVLHEFIGTEVRWEDDF